MKALTFPVIRVEETVIKTHERISVVEASITDFTFSVMKFEAFSEGLYGA